MEWSNYFWKLILNIIEFLNMAEQSEKSQNQKITVGLDIGTTKVCAMVASKDEENEKLNIIGIGIAETDGLNRGVVSNIDKTVKSIKAAIEQAQQQSGIEIKNVVVGIAGDHVNASQTRGIIGISNPTQEVTKKDVERLLEETKKVAIPSERRILHVIPQEFIIDGQDGIYDPVGMSGVRLEAIVQIVTGLETAIKNIYRCVERAGLNVQDLILEPLASSNAVLTEEEKEVGVALVDIGGGTTDIAIFEEGIIRYTSVFAVAGKLLTGDIRKGLGLVHSQAERIKRDYGHSFLPTINNNDVFMIPGIGGRKPKELSKEELCGIIQPRMEEILEFALKDIIESGYGNNLGAGIVLTGGTILLRGTEDLASEIFNMPVKIGIPSRITYSGLAPEVENPIYSTSVGLALHGLNLDMEQGEIRDEAEEDIKTEENAVDDANEKMQKKDNKKKSIIEKAKDFIREL